MHKGRMEAFTDGVMAIIITIMVLELKTPSEPTWAALAADSHAFLGYLLSFAYVGIYWNSHHHILQANSRIDGSVLLANLNILFWLSLLPFSTRWISEVGIEQPPVLIFGINLLLCAFSWTFFEIRLKAAQTKNAHQPAVTTARWKIWVSTGLYLAGVGLTAAGLVLVGYILLWGPVLLWGIPDKRIERMINSER